jgi:lysozyme
MASKWAKTAAATGSAGVIAAAVVFTPTWEGMDSVAKPDMIGTGHPMTYCYGQTDEFGKVKAGTRFTKQQCDELLAKSLPKYLNKIEPCIKVPLPDKTKASLLDAAYNAGPAAVCRSPMVAKMNAGDLRGGCRAFDGWYVRSDGKVRRGLVARRSGDSRKGEKQLCLEGLEEGVAPIPKAKPLSQAEFAADPYACFGAGRYDAMRSGKQCDIKKWWHR